MSRPVGGARLRRIEARQARFRATLLFVAVLLVMGVAGGLSILLLNGSVPEPELAFIQQGTLVRSIPARCLIIRDETLYPAPSKGTLRPMAAEGARVPAKGLLAYVTPKEGIERLDELSDIEQQIADLQRELLLKGKGQAARAIFDETDQNLSLLADLMRRALVRTDLTTADRISSSMRILIERRNGELAAVDFKDARLDLLKEKKAEQEVALGKESGALRATDPGIVSYEVDGLESILTDASVESILPGEVDSFLDTTSKQVGTTSEIEAGTPLLRVIESPIQFLVFHLKDTSAASFRMDSLQRVQFPLEGGAEIIGRVVRAEDTATGLILVLKTDRFVERFADRRSEDAELVMESDSGLKIPLSSFVSFDQKTGLAVVKIVTGGYVRLAQVLVIAADRDEAVVKPHPDSSYPIALYGILVLDPSVIEEGEYIG